MDFCMSLTKINRIQAKIKVDKFEEHGFQHHIAKIYERSKMY